MTSRILFVCLGNICRSPAAEGAVRALAESEGLGLTLDSAGLGGWHVGNPPYPPMQRAARARGLDLSDLRARQFQAADFDAFDLVLGMDFENMRGMEALRPPGNETPLRLFAPYAADTGADEVPDPYFTGDFLGVLDLIEQAAAGLVGSIRSGRV